MFNKRQSPAHPQITEDYIFDNEQVLPEGTWDLQIESGDAWIFSNNGNFSLHVNETVSLNPSDGNVRIKRLYTKGMVKFVAKKL